MSILRRLSTRSRLKFWAEAGLGPLEEAVNYAHLRASDGLRGILFLTNYRLIWRIHEPGHPPGSGFSLALNNIVAAEPTPDVSEQAVFRVAAPESSGEVVYLDFFPQRVDRASLQLSVDLYKDLIAELERIADLRRADGVAD